MAFSKSYMKMEAKEHSKGKLSKAHKAHEKKESKEHEKAEKLMMKTSTFKKMLKHAKKR